MVSREREKGGGVFIFYARDGSVTYKPDSPCKILPVASLRYSQVEWLYFKAANCSHEDVGERVAPVCVIMETYAGAG